MKGVEMIRIRLRLGPIATVCAVVYIVGSVFAPTIAFACEGAGEEKEGGLGKLTPSEQPIKWLGIGVREKEHFDYEKFPAGATNEEAKLGTTAIEQKQIAGKTGEFKIERNECEGKNIATGFSCLVEIEYKGPAESLEWLEKPVCAWLVQPYKGVTNPGNGSAARAKVNCE